MFALTWRIWLRQPFFNNLHINELSSFQDSMNSIAARTCGHVCSNLWLCVQFKLHIDDIFVCRYWISDCEKSLENVPTNVYESVCGSEISDFLGNQRTTPNSQNYTNSKSFSSLTNGKSIIFLFLGWYQYCDRFLVSNWLKQEHRHYK